MREWATPRVMGVAIILMGAPIAALAQLAFSWYPQTRRVALLDEQLDSQAQTLRTECETVAQLRVQVLRLEEAVAQRCAENSTRWLPQRDREGVFDQLAASLQSPDVIVDELAAGDPGLFGATSRAHVLAAESIVIRCTGAYPALAAVLDRLAALETPLEIAEVDWQRSGLELSLRLVVQVPFVPDEPLRRQLADHAGLTRGPNEP